MQHFFSSCWNRVLTTRATLTVSASALKWPLKKRNLQILVRLLINVPSSISCNVKKTWLHIELHDTGVHNRPSDKEYIICYEVKEMLIKQNTIYYGETTSSVSKMTWHHAQSLGCFLYDLIYSCRAVLLRIEGHSNILCCIDPWDWLTEHLYWLGLL